MFLPPDFKKKPLWIACLVLYLSFHLFYLEKFLRIDIDDAYLCEPAWNFLQTGKVAVPTWRGIFGGEVHEARYGRLFIFAQLPFLLMFGPRPLAVRLPALLFGLLLLWLTYALGKYVYEKKTAGLATLLLALSGIFFLTTHHGRPDTMLASFALAAFMLFLKAKEKSNLKLFFSSGLLSTLSADVHLNGLMIFLSLGLFFVFDLRSKTLFFRHFVAWSIGAACGFGWWLAIHILPNPAVFFENWKGMVSGEGQSAFSPPIFRTLNPLHWLQMEWNRYLNGYWTGAAKRNLVELLVISCSAAALFLKKNRSDSENKMVLYVLSFLILFPVLVSQKTFWYLIYLYPFFLLWIADMFFRGERFPSVFRIISVSALLLLYFGNMAVWAAKYGKADYEQFMKEIKQTITPGSAVMGDMLFWFGFAKEAKNFASLTDVEGFERILGLDFLGYLQYWETDYVIVQTDEHNQAGYSRIRPFLEKHAEPVGNVETEFYGAGAVSKGKQKEFTIFKVHPVREKSPQAIEVVPKGTAFSNWVKR